MKAEGETLADRVLARVVDLDTFVIEDLWDLVDGEGRSKTSIRNSLSGAVRRLVSEGFLDTIKAPHRGGVDRSGRWRYRQ